MTNEQQPPPPVAERAVFVPSLAPADHDDSVPFQPSSCSTQPASEDTVAHAHSHWQSHLRRRFAHSRSHLSSFSSSSPDHELETTDSNDDSHDLFLRSENQDTHKKDRTSDASKLDADADAQPADSEPSLVPRVIETVSIVRVVDTEGRVIDTQVIYPSSESDTTDSPAGETAEISAPGSSGTAAPGTAPGASDSVPYPTSQHSDATSGAATASATSLGDTQSLAPTASVTHVPSASPSIPSLSSISGSLPPLNATNTPFSSNSSSTSSLTTPTSLTTPLSMTILSITSTPTSSTSTTLDSTTTSSLTDDSWSSLDSDWASPTGEGGSVGQGRNGGSGPATSTAAGDSNADGDGSGSSGGINLTQQQKQIVGGVVGGVAGAAFFLLFILMAIKWKKRRSDVQELIGERGIASRGLPSPRGFGGSGDAPPMTQRSSSFGVAGAFASFTGRKSQPPPAEGNERGFYRVSGRKLPSVLQHGGDGYSDPRRHSTGSGSTEWHRGSQSFEPSGNSPLALGSPMRPVSGVAIMRSGPARTPVTEQNPFADPPSPSSFPMPPDGHGFGHDPHDERIGPTGFKFQESI